MSQPKQPICRTCGKSRDLVWRQSSAGKWYLADLFYGPRGSEYTLPHFKSCGKSADNAARAAKILADEAEWNALLRSGNRPDMSRDEWMRLRGHK